MELKAGLGHAACCSLNTDLFKHCGDGWKFGELMFSSQKHLPFYRLRTWKQIWLRSLVQPGQITHHSRMLPANYAKFDVVSHDSCLCLC